MRPRVAHIAQRRRLLVVALTWIGGSLGWLVLPQVHGWLGPLVRIGGWRGLLAGMTLLSIYWMLGRAIADMLTDLRDWRYLDRDDPLRDRLTIVDGRLGWGPSILMIWTSIESLLALLASGAVVVGVWSQRLLVGSSLSKSVGQWSLELIGWIALEFACFSVLTRNANPVFPLPYRWLGFSRNATEKEARELLWPWSRRRTPP